MSDVAAPQTTPQLPSSTVQAVAPKLGLALSGGGHRAAFFHIGVLAKLAEFGLLRRVEVISTVSGGSILGALYYLHVKNLLEARPDHEISDADYVQLVRGVERDYREAAATNVRGSAWANLLVNLKMAKASYSRTDRVGELYEQRFYARAWGAGPRREGRIAMRDLLILPQGHEGSFDPDVENASRGARVPVLLLEATTLNTGHNWRFEAMYMGEPPLQGTPNESARADVDKNVILARTRWDALPESCRDLPLGAAVVSSACFPGGFPPMQVPHIFEPFAVELVDGGVHDNQGVEGLVDRSCTHMIISDGSGQMPDLPRPSPRLPAVLGRVVSIYGDAERQQRLLDALKLGESVAFMHLQTGLPATSRAPDGATATEQIPMETTAFGVHVDVQHALANVRTDLDAFCDTEAWALMADGYQLAGHIVPSRTDVYALATPGPAVEWAFGAVAAQLGPGAPDPHFLKILHTAKERFLKPARMMRGGLALVLGTMVAIVVAATVGLWLLLTPHGTVLFAATLATLVGLGIYFGSEKAFVKPLATAIFDVLTPLLLALPLLGAAGLQLAAGRRWCALGRVKSGEQASPISGEGRS